MGFTETTSRMKLLAVIEAGSVTGPAKNLLDFCRSALEHPFPNLPRIETSIATFCRPSTRLPPNIFVEKAQASGIVIDVIEERFRFDRQIMTELKQLIHRVKPDLIQTHNVKSHFLIRLSGVWREIPWIAFHHGYTTTDWRMRAYNQLDRWSLRKAQRLVTMNQVFAEQLARAGAPRPALRILHNAIDVDGILEVADEKAAHLKTLLGIKDKESVILAIGRMSGEKGHSDLLKAFAKLQAFLSAPKTRLVMVGEGPERSKLEQEVAALNLTQEVIFAGQVNDVKPFYAIADVMVLPSHNEGSPNVLLEAMAAKVPVVATKVGGVPEIATHNEDALLVEARDHEALAAAMNSLLRDSEMAVRLATQAQQRVIKNHAPAARLQALLKIYQELLPQPNGTASSALYAQKN
ncbi:MAG: glycosyltransferase [Acidobacteria bacterium]|nr:glycosyltransferase [Acidobacteriota bacterium]